jgi:hypothetical protein
MGYGLVNGFIDHLYTPLGTISNYSAIADFHTLPITNHYTLSLLSLPCRTQLSTDWVPGWRPFHTNILVFSSQADFQLTTSSVAPVVCKITPRDGPHRRRRLTILWAFTACYRDSFTFFTYILVYLNTHISLFDSVEENYPYSCVSISIFVSIKLVSGYNLLKLLHYFRIAVVKRGNRDTRHNLYALCV